jgi:16S rRNA (adenine1518-N6/adenine1519-N6)-dimethyltransferase
MAFHDRATAKRRTFGQHFLRDEKISKRIAETAVDLARKNSCVAMLEVGPGRGAITLPLIEELRPRGIPLQLCEKDRAIAQMWREKIAVGFDGQEVSIEERDFLELREEVWLARAPLAVVSNLPYSVGTAILLRLVAKRVQIPVMVLMFQAEVAQRLRAVPATKSWGSLSVFVQNHWDVQKLLSVPPGAFSPPPEVDSEVVVLTRRLKPRITFEDEVGERAWDRLLKAAFLHRRKMLRSGFPKTPEFQNALAHSGVDGTKRAEALEWEEWDRLYRAFRSQPSG